ncbi:SH3 domain-containing protein [Saccharibacter sp. 17.LH.SD]|uniref:SH3 domain-containing protein n=1 Tax=Saccharibacter sp. 17.LH.SD TaxID=2689393 RepID=UPI0019280DCC|nr:SH3 domain-containing protein [Saccharibacter sp. 17.LH.SD]
MRPPVSFCRLASVGIPLLLAADLLIDASPAKGEEQVAPHKSAHHSHHHKKASSAHHHEDGGDTALEERHAHRHHGAHKGEHHGESGHHAETPQKDATAGSTAPVTAPTPVPAQQAADKGSETGLPLPRFAALRADRVYMRRGPGERYPIEWVYRRRNYPVMIEREFGLWRLVEDVDGQKGWVHQVTLRGGRSFVIPGPSASNGDATKLPTTQHADPRIIAYVRAQDPSVLGQNRDVPLMSSEGADRKVIAVLQPGTVGTIKACPQGSSWCHVTVRGYDGWLERQLLWGVQPGEIIQPD